MMTSRVRWGWAVLVMVSLTAVNPNVRGDGNGYYAWLVSAVLDHDLDFENQFRHADPLFQTLVFEPDGAVRPEIRTPTGKVGNQWSVGPAVLWAPWFVAAHAAVLVARAAGSTVAADGYSWPYRWVVGVGTALYGWLALWLSALAARRLGATSGVGLAVLGVAGASSLPVYQFFLPFHVHALSACVVAAYVAFWVARRDRLATEGWVLWGGLAGVMVQVYQLNGVLLLLAVWQWGRLARTVPVRVSIVHGASFAVAGLLVCLPQLLGKGIVYGTPFVTGYQDEFVWSDPRWWQTALSANHGVLTWTPVVALALVGLWRLIRHRRDVAVLGVITAVFYLVVASYQNWHGQSSFGNRFFVSLTIIFVVGLAWVLEDLMRRGRRWRPVAVGVVAVLSVWNAGLAFQWGTNIIPNRGAVDFAQVARQQVTVVPGRLAGFVMRYFGDRQAMIEEVEHVDGDERRAYTVVR